MRDCNLGKSYTIFRTSLCFIYKCVLLLDRDAVSLIDWFWITDDETLQPKSFSCVKTGMTLSSAWVLIASFIFSFPKLCRWFPQKFSPAFPYLRYHLIKFICVVHLSNLHHSYFSVSNINKLFVWLISGSNRSTVCSAFLLSRLALDWQNSQSDDVLRGARIMTR